MIKGSGDLILCSYLPVEAPKADEVKENKESNPMKVM
jgi:hypothetical protein